MRANARLVLALAAVAAAAALGADARAAIRIVQASGQNVPQGAATIVFNPAANAYDITLLQLYAPWQDTVYEIRASGGEVIDHVIIAIDGPPAGSPVIVRVLGEAPLGLRAVHTILQTGSAETILNRVSVSQDIGSVQVEVIGDLIAGRDIAGPIVSTTSDNGVRGVTSAQAARDILGDVLAENGRIGLVWGQHAVGGQQRPVNIHAKHHVMHVMGPVVFADINTRVNGGAGGLWALVADEFTGTLNTEKLIFNQANGIDGLIKITARCEGLISIGKSFTNPAQLMQLPAHGLRGQIIFNADNAPGGAWTTPVRIGADGDPQQIILTGPSYPQTPAMLGGGSVGLVPFRLHAQACTPLPGQTITMTGSATSTVELRHYGPVLLADGQAGTPLLIERRSAGSAAPFSPVPLSDFTIAPVTGDACAIRIAAAPAKPGFAPGYEYRIWPGENLRCDVPAQPQVLWSTPYTITIIAPQCIGDVDGDGLVNFTDILLVIVYWGTPATALPRADVNADGIVNLDDLLQIIIHWGAC